MFQFWMAGDKESRWHYPALAQTGGDGGSERALQSKHHDTR